jgi:N-formylglutamate deformylase
MKDCYTSLPGKAPMLISVPHAGTRLSPGMAETMTPETACLPDTDWFVDRLYEFAGDMGASILRANFSRYVIDLNRPPDGTRLYPGRAETELCATTHFDGQPVYQTGREPSPSEIDARKQRYWQPYHQKLQAELNRLRAIHDQVILWDAHSIRSEVPRLFEGRLPDLNFGTAGGSSCASEISCDLLALAETHSSFRTVLNGRFKGGYITRHYGLPARGIHAIQLEIAQSAYMDETAPAFDPDRASPLTQILRDLVSLALKRIEAASSS